MIYRLTRTVTIHDEGTPPVTLYPGLIEEAQARRALGRSFEAALDSGALEPHVDPLPHNGWPTAVHAEGAPEKRQPPAPTHTRPITQAAMFSVRCLTCGAAADSACETPEGAIASVASAHDVRHTRYKAVAYAPR